MLIVLAIYLTIGLFLATWAYDDSTPEEQADGYYRAGLIIGIFIWIILVIRGIIKRLIKNIAKEA
jgi:hypothetical protein